jgi:hypothetical protein
VLISDGAWGTFLYRKGLKPGECPDEWSLTHPAETEDIALSYILAESDMVETNRFGANRRKLTHSEKTPQGEYRSMMGLLKPSAGRWLQERTSSGRTVVMAWNGWWKSPPKCAPPLRRPSS